ncbi:histidine phosphatase family protein [Nocardioides sp. zg-DK7169]|nr:histidine phosphatase family protein [Nocardioides sp. zg-DK7169]NPC96326.1 histidine phosphatase family protein [Nocardioides sp. zg-DK7169]
MRHAQAESHGPSDHERELAPRGRRDARAGGEWLAARGITPDAALVSAALRTRETWESLATGAGWDLDAAAFDEGLYSAGAEAALDLVRGTDDDVRTLVLIGHNPTVGVLAQQLDDGQGDPEASVAMLGGYPTAATTVFEVGSGWSDLGAEGARVVAFHVPRD